MHPSTDEYLALLQRKGRSPLTLKATRADLGRFISWWETTRRRQFDPSLLLEEDVRAWRGVRQRDDAAAPATINRGLSALRGYCAWALATGVLVDDPAAAIGDVRLPELGPRSLPTGAVDALLRAAHQQRDPRQRLRDEALLALLVYAGLRAQEACDVQLRDLDLAGGTITVRSGKAGKARRLPLHANALVLLQRYLTAVRCPSALPALGSAEECEPLLGRLVMTAANRPLQPGITQRVVRASGGPPQRGGGKPVGSGSSARDATGHCGAAPGVGRSTAPRDAAHAATQPGAAAPGQRGNAAGSAARAGTQPAFNHRHLPDSE